jgi:hypothetical protein
LSGRGWITNTLWRRLAFKLVELADEVRPRGITWTSDDSSPTQNLRAVYALSNDEGSGRKQNEQHRHDNDPNRLAENETPTRWRRDDGHVPVLPSSGGPSAFSRGDYVIGRGAKLNS